MGRSPGFVPNPCHSYALFRLAFATAPGVTPLTWRQRLTRWLILQKARGHTLRPPPRPHTRLPEGSRAPASPVVRDTIVLPLLVGTRFQVLFTPLTGVLFTFPSRYLFTIGRQEYLALEGGPPCFPQDFPSPVVLRVIGKSLSPFAYGAITLCGRPFSVPFC